MNIIILSNELPWSFTKVWSTAFWYFFPPSLNIIIDRWFFVYVNIQHDGFFLEGKFVFLCKKTLTMFKTLQYLSVIEGSNNWAITKSCLKFVNNSNYDDLIGIENTSVGRGKMSNVATLRFNIVSHSRGFFFMKTSVLHILLCRK